MFFSAGKIERFLDLGFFIVFLFGCILTCLNKSPNRPINKSTDQQTNTKMTAFITRDLTDHSEFKNLLTAAGWEAEGRSLVELSPLPFYEIPDADWIFFSSQNAVRFFFENQGILSVSDFKPPSALKHNRWAALGPATAKALADFVESVDFTGTGEPRGTAEAFRRGGLDPVPGSRILFPAARHSRQSVMSFLSDAFQCMHFPVYNNRLVADPPGSTADVLVFTSPMNAEAYFTKNSLVKNQHVVAIGETTGAALRELGLAEIHIAAEPSERGLADAVLKFDV